MLEHVLDQNHNRVVSKELPIPLPASPDAVDTLSEGVAYLLSEDHRELADAERVLSRVQGPMLESVSARAFGEENEEALLDVHQALFAMYETSLSNPLSRAARHEHSPWLASIRQTIEQAWLAWEMPKIQGALPDAEEAADPAGLVAWFYDHATTLSSLDSRIASHLEHHATLEEMNQFVLADGYLNYRFYDAITLAALHYSEAVKAEICTHYWDECGAGDFRKAHTIRFTEALERLGLTLPLFPMWNNWRPFAGYNLYLLLGLNRRYYFRSLGSLAMPELFDPVRDRAVNNGFERLGFDPERDFGYYYTHMVEDEEHGDSWLDKVIKPIVQEQPEAGIELAVGGALRMTAFRRYNEYLAMIFDLKRQAAHDLTETGGVPDHNASVADRRRPEAGRTQGDPRT